MTIEPCPVCGRSNAQTAPLVSNHYYVRCQEACLYGPACSTLDEAITAWNRLSRAATNTRNLEVIFQRSRDLVLVHQQDGTWHGGTGQELAEGATWDAVVTELAEALGGEKG